MRNVKEFLGEDFLLSNQTAIELFNKYSKNLPIVDYHCHLNPKEIWEDTKYENIGQLFLKGDHYKWRVMRSSGVHEDYMTGNKSDYEKFLAFASVLPLAIGNPVYHWTHLELKKYFDVREPLTAKNAAAIWEKTSQEIKGKSLSVRKYIEASNVELICTTDDPVDSLEYHLNLKNEGKFKTKVLPTFRPDKALQINADGYEDYIAKLSEVTNMSIENTNSLIDALYKRVDFFAQNGCLITDHAIAQVPYGDYDSGQADKVFKKRLLGERLSQEEADGFYTYILQKLATKYHSLGMAMQLHIGTIRNNNRKMFRKLGPDIGFDSVLDGLIAKNLATILDNLESENCLPKTILYSLDPKDYYVLATMCGNFQSSEAKCKIQFGTAWWFCDNIDGMRVQMRTLGNLGVLGLFIGMLTDSRSFLSYPRHEYFRRILCDIIGTWVENGEYPNDMDSLGEIVSGISYNNVKRYLNLV